MTLILRPPWTRQPQTPFELKRERGLSAVWVGSVPHQTLGLNEPTVISATNVAFAADVQGRTASFTNGSNTGSIRLAADADSVLGTDQATIAIWRRCRDTTARASTLFGYQNGASDVCQAAAPFSDGNLYWDFGNQTGNSGRISVGYTKDTNWETLVFIASPIRGREVWRRGVRIANSTIATATRSATSQAFNIGRRAGDADNADNYDIALACVSRRAWSEAEIIAWSQNPYGETFQPRRIWVPVSAGGSSPVTITTGIGAATASGTTAVVNRAQTIATGTGAASAAGVQAIINRAQFIAATIGAATASGTTASVNLARFVATGIGAATAAGTQASIVADGAVVITTGIGAATAAGVQARIDLARFIATGIGAASASGTQATITNAADVVVSTGVGAATADGAAATFIRNVLVACGVGNATADGTQATVIGEGLEPAETRRRGGGNRFVLARKRLPSAYLIDWLTNEEPSEETKRVIREIKAGRPLPERLDPPKVEKQITPEQLAAKLIPRRLINLSEVLPIEQTQLIRKAVRIAQERDDEDILMLL